MPSPWALSLYLYLLVLLVLPILARWRRGLGASLAVVAIELGLVALIYYLLSAYRVFPDPFAGKPAPRAPMEILRQGREQSVVAMVHLFAWAIVPAIAALAGVAVALVWSAIVAFRRSAAARRAWPADTA
jgi:hypothetical protein